MNIDTNPAEIPVYKTGTGIMDGTAKQVSILNRNAPSVGLKAVPGSIRIAEGKPAPGQRPQEFMRHASACPMAYLVERLIAHLKARGDEQGAYLAACPGVDDGALYAIIDACHGIEAEDGSVQPDNGRWSSYAVLQWKPRHGPFHALGMHCQWEIVPAVSSGLEVQ